MKKNLKMLGGRDQVLMVIAIHVGDGERVCQDT